MVEPSSCDVVVIGAGIGGYVAAIRAAQLGMSVAIVEKGDVGGTCLNRGCIPTKALLASTSLLSKIRRSEDFGIAVRDVSFDFKKMMARKDAVVDRLASGVKYLLKKNKIRLIEGKGTIISNSQVCVKTSDGRTEYINAKNIIIASGSEQAELHNVHVDRKNIITTDEALKLECLPESLAIIGGGVMGVEFAEIFNALGVQVTILEEAPSILPSLDIDLGRTLQRTLKKRGIEVYTGIRIESVEVENAGRVQIRASSSGSQLDLKSEKVLLIAERKASTKDLGLENIGVQLRDSFIAVDEHMRTNVPNVYAVGDVTGKKMFAHAAFAEGIVAAESIAGMKTAMDYKTVPTCVYTSLEIGSVGLSEKEATDLGHNISVGKLPYMANGRALTLGEGEGFVKTVADSETDEILGVHIIGPNATELIGEAAIAMKLECTSEELGKTTHAHPTLSEAIMEAALAVSKKAVHM